MLEKLKTVYISWQPYCSRSDSTAREFGGNSYKVYFDIFGSNYYTIIFKYIFQTIATLSVLFRDNPDVVFVMNPPIFACIPVYIYCKLKNAEFIIDAHTGAFIDKMWRKVKFLLRFLSRRALFTIITNYEIGEELRDWECEYVIVPDVPIKYETPKIPLLEKKPNVTLVNTFAIDEPIDNFLSAARKLEKINFHITGKLTSSTEKYRSKQSANIKFTDFLADDEYYGLLFASDLIVVLTTRDKTMQRGAYEAIYLGKPVVTSDWKILRDNFPSGAIFVDNSSESIIEGVIQGLNNLEKITQEAIKLRSEKFKIWNTNMSLMEERIIKSSYRRESKCNT